MDYRPSAVQPKLVSETLALLTRFTTHIWPITIPPIHTDHGWALPEEQSADLGGDTGLVKRGFSGVRLLQDSDLIGRLFVFFLFTRNPYVVGIT